MIYFILGVIVGIQIISLKLLLKSKKKEKHYYPSVQFSSEDPQIGHIVMWSIGDIWINYEKLKCFTLSNEKKRHWRLIGCKGYTEKERKKMKDCDTKDWDIGSIKEE